MVSDSSRRSALRGLGCGLVGLGSAVVGSGASRLDVSAGARQNPDADDADDAGLDWPMARYDAAGTGYNPRASGPTDGVREKWVREPDEFSGGTGSPVLVDGTLFATGGSLLALDADSGETRFAHEGSYRSSPARAAAEAYATDTLAVTAPAGAYGLNAGGGLRLLGRAFGVERWHGPGEEPGFSVFGPPTAVPPVAVDGTVYAAIPGTEHVVALDASSGRERWRVSPGDELHRPAVRDGRLYAVNWPSQTSAYDAATGERLWRTDLADQMVLPPTATADGVVVPQRTGISALAAEDGSVRWRFDHDGNATEGAAAVAEGTVYVQSNHEDGALHALNLATGEERWSATVSGEGTPVVADGVVYARDYNDLVAVDASDGTVRWRYDSRMPISTPAIGDGVLYAVSHGRIVALAEGER
ncbi:MULTISPECIES: PQQ-binding-like beta-propeller repeat protein [Halorussus]|uniref:outer membrane protein assembly factor BamB family protein n=1 Tax=Halorussus TaxID=1070314 RepID=UPI000E210C73|nr:MULTISPECIES: PQQ-binding-like beta-propeller repeat protein [Halorussus]NHN58409.1 PQQ-binding-like beta-propeller repeat protein [Halorussus sp. JP-T4]